MEIELNEEKTMKKYDVSVLVCTYNPDKTKLLETLFSIINQKGISFQVVVSDDGSKNDFHEEMEKFMKDFCFVDYIFTKLSSNQGTVKNVINGLNYCEGEYVKALSPGDGFLYMDSLKKWHGELQLNGNDWSFGKVINYHMEGNKIIPSHEEAWPLNTDIYNSKNEKKMMWNYLVLGDIAVGASMLTKTSVLKEYLSLIEGKVIYAEDHAYRLMVLDKRIPFFYPSNVVYYEYGTGISTSNLDFWDERIRKDYETAGGIMKLSVKNPDAFQNKIIKINNLKRNCSLIEKIYRLVFVKKGLGYGIKRSFFPRLTEVEWGDFLIDNWNNDTFFVDNSCQNK